MKTLLLLHSTLLQLLSQSDFNIAVYKGSILTKKGIIDGRFVNDCKDIVETNNVQSGLIYVNKSNRQRLRMIWGMDKGLQQRFRNTWSFYT